MRTLQCFAGEICYSLNSFSKTAALIFSNWVFPGKMVENVGPKKILRSHGWTVPQKSIKKKKKKQFWRKLLRDSDKSGWRCHDRSACQPLTHSKRFRNLSGLLGMSHLQDDPTRWTMHRRWGTLVGDWFPMWAPARWSIFHEHANDSSSVERWCVGDWRGIHKSLTPNGFRKGECGRTVLMGSTRNFFCPLEWIFTAFFRKSHYYS